MDFIKQMCILILTCAKIAGILLLFSKQYCSMIWKRSGFGPCVTVTHTRSYHMYTANLNTLDLLEAWYEHDPHMRVKFNVPFSQATGNASSAVVYFEIEPGHYLGTHTDSAEEIVLLLS